MSKISNTRSFGLTTRMLIALLALVGLYIALGYAAAMLFGAFVGPTGTGHFISITLMLVFLFVAQYYYGANIALKMMGGTVVEREQYPDIHSRVDRLAQQTGITKPKVAVSPNSTPNAFAAGRGEENAVICVTQGALRELDGDELDAVLAHELSHIMNRDYRLMTTIAALIAAAGWFVRWGWLFGDGGGGDSGNAMYYLAGWVIVFFVWIGGFLVGRLLSRYREYAADKGAAEITGDPLALASALRTISDKASEAPKEDIRDAQNVNALLAAEVTERKGISSLIRTHPSVEDRVERLEEMASEVEN